MLAATPPEVAYAGPPADIREHMLKPTTKTWTGTDGRVITTTNYPLTGEEKFVDSNRPDGKVISSTKNQRTGEYEFNKSTTDPKTGEVKRTTYNKDKDGKWTWTETTINAGGCHSETYGPRLDPMTLISVVAARSLRQTQIPWADRKRPHSIPKLGT